MAKDVRTQLSPSWDTTAYLRSTVVLQVLVRRVNIFKAWPHIRNDFLNLEVSLCFLVCSVLKTSTQKDAVMTFTTSLSCVNNSLKGMKNWSDVSGNVDVLAPYRHMINKRLTPVSLRTTTENLTWKPVYLRFLLSWFSCPHRKIDDTTTPSASTPITYLHTL